MEKAIKYHTNLIETFKHIKAEKDTALIDYPGKLFVNSDTYRKLTETETYVVIGRKGAGKTALIDIFRNSEKRSYKIIIDIIADQENSWLLYNWFYNIFSDLHKKTHDHREFFDMVSLFATAWAAAIQMIMMERVIRDEQMLDGKFGAELDSIRKYLKKQLGVGDELRGRTVQSVLPVIFELIQRKIEMIFELGGTFGTALGRISPIPFEKIFGDNYFVPPIFLNDDHFGREVKYDPDFVQRKNQAIKFDVSPNGEINGQISDPAGIAALKSPDWEFQREYRFVLFIVPSLPASEDENFLEQFYKNIPNIVATSLYKGKGPDLEFFDVKLSQSAIDNIKITTGPLCNDGDYLTIEALLDKYSSNGTIMKSKFEGTIRKPIRQ